MPDNNNEEEKPVGDTIKKLFKKIKQEEETKYPSGLFKARRKSVKRQWVISTNFLFFVFVLVMVILLIVFYNIR
ncbi:MAG TPA: hypothetical protein VJ583_03450 [Nitrososphaeraceae archaeon]|nr:hypothetical protein [Nitrososphaeraceae archaeon]